MHSTSALAGASCSSLEKLQKGAAIAHRVKPAPDAVQLCQRQAFLLMKGPTAGTLLIQTQNSVQHGEITGQRARAVPCKSSPADKAAMQQELPKEQTQPKIGRLLLLKSVRLAKRLASSTSRDETEHKWKAIGKSEIHCQAGSLERRPHRCGHLARAKRW